jgi:serine/threonine protein kinase
MSPEHKYTEFGKKFSFLYGEEESPSEQGNTIYSELSNSSSRYTGDEEIAKGGMKSIKKVYDNSTARYMARADLLPHIDEVGFEIFLREARLTALLEHPNIISTQDIGINDDGRPYFIMDLKVGDSLAVILSELDKRNESYIQRYKLEDLLSIFLKICDAVEYAHSRNVIHLDLKPSNIQVGEFGEVLVCDWGLGKIVGSDETGEFEEILLNKNLLKGMTRHDQVKGTPGYMAPEQITLDSTTDFVSDIYSLGCILYSIVTYKRPLDGSVDKVMTETVQGKIMAPKNPHYTIPESISAIIMHAIAIKKENRYRSVTELKNDLSKYQSGYMTNAEDSSFVKQLRLFYLRNRVTCNLLLIFVLLSITATGLFIRRLNQSRREAEASKESAEQALQLYKEEKKSGQAVRDAYVGDLKINNLIYSSNRNYIDDPEKLLLKSLKEFRYAAKLKPDDPYPQIMIGQTLFILQRYAEAKKYIYKYPELNIFRPGLDEALKYEKSDDNLVPVYVLAKVLNAFRSTSVKIRPTLFRAVVYDLNVRKDFTDYIQVVEQVLHIWNPKWDGYYRYRKEGAILRIRGANFHNPGMTDKKLGSYPLFLFPSVLHLDIGNTGVVDLSLLKNNQFEKLDIRNTKIKDLSPLLHLSNFYLLIISERQFTPKQLQKVPNTVTITVR